MYEGAPDYPDKDVWWELCERYGVTIFYTAPTAIRACMKWGAEYPGAPRPLVAAAAGHGRRADQPEGVALVLEGDRRRALPDRRHLVADRDRPDHDHDPARRAGDEARLGGQAAARESRPRSSTRRATRSAASRACWPCAGRGRGCCARSIATTTATSRPTSRSSARETYFVGDAARQDDDGYFWVIGRVDDVINVSGHRLSTAEVESAIVSPPEGRRGGGDRPGRRGHRPVDLRLRHPRGRPRGHRRAGRRDPRARRRADRQARAPEAGRSGPTTCRRPAPARSCAGCCATSPRAASSAT